MEIAFSDHRVRRSAKVIVVVSDTLVPLYEKRFTDLEVAVSFIQKLQEKGILFTKRTTRYQILVLVQTDEDYRVACSNFTRLVWGGNVITESKDLQDYFIQGFN